MTPFEQTLKDILPLNPTRLFRRWKAAAGPVAGLHVPAAPFTALSLYGEPAQTRQNSLNPVALDQLCQRIAGRLAETEQIAAVQEGEAALLLDLPGAFGIGLAFYLQAAGIAPALAWGGLYRPGAVLEGRDNLTALIRYGRQVRPWSGQKGLAFILEQERSGPPDLDDLKLWAAFDNRYHAGENLLPPLATLQSHGIEALIDLRPENHDLPEDLDLFYQRAALAGLSVYQAYLPARWLTEV